MIDHRRCGVVLAAVALGLCCACGPAQAVTSPSPSPSASAGYVPSLLAPNVATEVVATLKAKAAGMQVIKVDINATQATLTAVDTAKKIHGWQWSKGRISVVESDVQYVNQASFDPSAFDFSNVAALFTKASVESGSNSNQDLQIVEYNQGQVLMTVTTNPESRAVFFRADGSVVETLDFSSAAGLAEAISDTAGTHTSVLAMGYSQAQGFWVDVASSTAGVIDRTIRTATVPAWSASRKGNTTALPFDPSLVKAASLASIEASLVAKSSAKNPGVSFTIDRRDKLAEPVIRWTVGGTETITDLHGRDLTSQLPR